MGLKDKSACTIFFLMLILGVLEMANGQLFNIKGLSSAKKMSDDDDGDFIGGIIEFVMDMLEMGSGLVDMAMSMGRKKRSILEEVLMPPPVLRHKMN